MHHDICVLSCYGLRDAQIVGFLNTLNSALDARGVRLLVLGTTPDPDFEGLYLEIPYLLEGFDRTLADVPHRPFHPVLATMSSEQDQTVGTQKRAIIERASAKCEAFYGAVATYLHPAAAFLWNTTLPHGRIARNTMTVMGVPAFCIERGWLPASFQLHATENNAFNDFFTDFALSRGIARLLRLYGEADEPFDRAQSFYRIHEVQKSATSAKLGAEALRAKYGIKEQRLIVCFVASAGSSVGTHEIPSMAYSSPLFVGINEGLQLLHHELRLYSGVRVLVQEHPIERAMGRAAQMPPGFVATLGENIHGLLEAADQHVFIGTSSIQVEALLYDKPRLTLSRHPAALFGATYSMVDEGSDAVRAWMDHTRPAACRTGARALVNYLCQERLIKDDDGPEFIERNVADMADFIAGLSRPQIETADERIARFVEQVGAMLKP